MADLTVTVNANAAGVSQAILEQARKAEAAMKKVPLRIQTTSLGGGFKTLTADVDRFDKSVSRMAAVISTFGQAAAIIFGIQNAFAAMVKTAISVEKQLADVNAIFNVTQSTLKEFGNGLFNISKETISSFDEVSKAAAEFARQGLSVGETLKRTRDAMALVKISGGDVESAVQSLTAAVNTFKGELLDTTTVLNKVTNVDAAYAVSARDLTESIKRAGATAQDAKVSFNELIAATAALQQSTARGGSVIGNSLKSIFTRVSRTDTLDLLDDLGIKTRNLEGEVRPAIEILKELSSVFNTLSDSQKSQVKESVAGVYQINALSALLADLSSKTSIYDGALAKANETTDSASARLKVLGETTSATLNTTGANLTKLAANLGKTIVTDNIDNFLTKVNKVFARLEEGAAGDLVEKAFGGAVKGVGDFLGSGGLILGARAGINISRLALEGVKDQFVAATTLNRASEKQLQLQEQIKQVLASQDPNIVKQITSAKTLAQQYERIFKILTDMNAAALASNQFSKGAADFIIKNKGSVVDAAVKQNKKRGFASGYLPISAERQAINKGVGGASKNARPVVIPNFNLQRGRRETIVANSSEYIVPNYANSGASAIFNQDMIKFMGLPRGAKKIMAGGHIPNFARPRYVYDDVDSITSGYIGADFPARRAAIQRRGEIPVRPDQIIDLLYDAKSPIKITDPSLALRSRLLAEAPELLSKVIITSPKSPLVNKFEETKLGSGLSPSINIKDILSGDKRKLSPVQKILEYGNANFGESFFLKPFIGAQGDSVLSQKDLASRKRLGSSSAYGGFFLQKGLKNSSKSGEEYRVHVSRVGGKAKVLGGAGSKFRSDDGKLYANSDFFQNRTSSKGLGAFLSREIATSQAKRLVQSLPASYDGTIAGVDVLGTGNTGIKKIGQYVSEKLGLPFFKGGGPIEYNFSQLETSRTQGGASGGLSRSDVLSDASKALRSQSKVYINDFVKRGNSIASMSGQGQSSSFKSYYKELVKLKKIDENAFYGIAKKLNATGNFGIDIGRGKNRQSLSQAAGAKYLSRIGFANGFVPNFALFSGRRAQGFAPEFVSPLDQNLRGVLQAPKNFFKSKGSNIEEIIKGSNKGRRGAYLEDVINFDNLFNAYPSLASSSIGLSRKGSSGLFIPSIIPGFGEIKIRQDLSRGKAGNTLIHELQHSIQNIERSFLGDDAIYKQFERDRKLALRAKDGARLNSLSKRYNLINSEVESNAAAALFRGRSEGEALLSTGEFFNRFVMKNFKANMANGHIPNLARNPLSDSVKREAVALSDLGYSKSEIFNSLRVQSSPNLKGQNNPEGLAVFNTLQGQSNINKAMSDHRGENLKTAGSVPNFAARILRPKRPPSLRDRFSQIKERGAQASRDFSGIGFKASFGIPLGLQAASALAGEEDSGLTRGTDQLSKYGSAAAALALLGPYGLAAAGATAAYGGFKAFDSSRERFSGQFGSANRLQRVSGNIQANEAAFGSVKGNLIDLETAKAKGGNNQEEIKRVFDQIIEGVNGIKDAKAASEINQIVSSLDSLENKIEQIKQVEASLGKANNILASKAALDTFVDKTITEKRDLKGFDSQKDLADLILGSIDIKNLPKEIIDNLDSNRYNTQSGDVKSFLFQDLGADSANFTGRDISVADRLVKQRIRETLDFSNKSNTGPIKIQEENSKTRKTGLNSISKITDIQLSERLAQSENKFSSLQTSLSDSFAPEFLKTAISGQIESTKIGEDLGLSKLEAGAGALDILKDIPVDKNNRQRLNETLDNLVSALSKGDPDSVETIVKQASLAGFNSEAQSSLDQLVTEMQKQNSTSIEQLKAVRDQTSKSLRKSLNQGFLGFGEALNDSEGFSKFGKAYSDSANASTRLQDRTNPNTPSGIIAREGADNFDKYIKAQAEIDKITFKNALDGDIKDNQTLVDAINSGDTNAFAKAQEDISNRRKGQADAFKAPLQTIVEGDAINRAKDAIGAFSGTDKFNRTFADDRKKVADALASGDINRVRGLASQDLFNGNKVKINNGDSNEDVSAALKSADAFRALLADLTSTVLDSSNISGAVDAKSSVLAGDTGPDVDLNALVAINTSVTDLSSITSNVEANTKLTADLLAANLRSSAESAEVTGILATQQDAAVKKDKASLDLKAAEDEITKRLSDFNSLGNTQKMPLGLRRKISEGITSGKSIAEIQASLSDQSTLVESSRRDQFGNKIFDTQQSELQSFKEFFLKQEGRDVDKGNTLSQKPSIDVNSLRENVTQTSQNFEDIVRSEPITAKNRGLAVDSSFNSILSRGQVAAIPDSKLIDTEFNALIKTLNPFSAELNKIRSKVTADSLPSEIQSIANEQNPIVSRFINSTLSESLPGLSSQNIKSLQGQAKTSIENFSSENSEGGSLLTTAEFASFAQSFIESINQAIETNNQTNSDTNNNSSNDNSNKAIEKLTSALSQGAEVTTRNVVDIKVEASRNSAITEDMVAQIKTIVSDVFTERETQQSLAFGNKPPGINIG